MKPVEWLLTDNETNAYRLWGLPNETPCVTCSFPSLFPLLFSVSRSFSLLQLVLALQSRCSYVKDSFEQYIIGKNPAAVNRQRGAPSSAFSVSRYSWSSWAQRLPSCSRF